MQLYFIDDSGTIGPPQKTPQTFFVLGGLIIPEEQWHSLESSFSRICREFQINGEIKWRFFGQKTGHQDKRNTLSHLSTQERDTLRRVLLTSLAFYESIKIIATIIHLPNLYSTEEICNPEQVHFLAYRNLIAAYQRRLHELSQSTDSIINGIIISDHKNPFEDAALRKLHIDILKSENGKGSKYPNLIENLFLAPSHHSIGIQFADLISGAIFRYFEHEDNRWYQLIESNFWKSPSGKIEDYDLIKIALPGKEKDAESEEFLSPPEPTLMT